MASKFNIVELTTLSNPFEALIAKAPDVFPESIENDRSCPASGSVAIIVPTAAPLRLFSANGNAWLLITGTSFTSVNETVTVAWLLKVPAPLSCTFITSAKDGVVSKLRTVVLATLITPLVASIAKAPDVFPDSIENALV